MGWCLRFQESDGFIVGAQRIKSEAAPTSSVEGFSYVMVSEVIYAGVVNALRHKPRGGLRWKWLGGPLPVEEPDNRPIVRFSHADGVDVDGVLTVQKVTGDPVSQITVEVVNALGEVRTNVTTSRDIIINGRSVTVSVTNGVGSLNVPTNHPRDVFLTNCPDFKVTQPIRVVVTQAQAYSATDL